jgi:hypothetical protein
MDKHEKAIEKSKEILTAEILGDRLDLNHRRAVFVYQAARLAAINANAPIIPADWIDREQDFKDQFLKVIERQMGEHRFVSPEEAHGSWMQAYFDRGWVYGDTYNAESRIHPDLVPFANLGKLEQDKDAVFILLCEIARQYIREVE